MRKLSQIRRFFGSMTLPAFAAFAGAIAAVLVFSAVVMLEQSYRVLVEGKAWTELASPPEVMIGLMLMSLVVSSGASFLLARSFQRVLQRFLAYLDDTTSMRPRGVESVMFKELRRLRVAVTRRVSHLRRENERLERIAYVDQQTGLPNTIALEAYIERKLPFASFDAPAAFFLLDLDQFGRAAERLGSLATNTLLNSVGERLTGCLAHLDAPVAASLEGSMVAALHNDQFAIFLPNAITRESVSNIARSIRVAFAQPFEINGQSISVGMSGGIVMAPEDADTAQKLFRHADLALQQVRQESASGFRYFSPRLNRVARGKYMLEAELREAVAAREFKAVFQPKVDFATGKIVGCEALARWQRANGKIISPAAFIPLAEETGLVNQIGEQILESACECAVVWMKEGFDVSVAVNVSPRQFMTVDLTNLVLEVLKRTGLPPGRLELEITESMAVSDPTKVDRVMRPLRALGVKLALDDFGTGHSNLSMLTQLPFDVFKIDRQFVSALDADRQAPAIVEMILAMAETLGLKTVAEGVETDRQAEFLSRRGCSMAQGFLYSPGLPQEGFLELLRGWETRSATSRKAS
ncbi:putative bifunctional diguanylate cyclase/phosphodiesterase [Hyphomonas jannaschiana]|uniref:Putative diguanylate cyclase n=1 Tax=Hyphomonas jannaschiana VP2 TaxID=1280952 RepID=A0A059FDE6_9PROT|nr:bifunctional diguanylate cyclase/phosphodiesterase [Hyphomonas jannaschiana]KCZ88622.1 putative diguanylate cyclase [Hyphomonas jannaschiana VP2]